MELDRNLVKFQGVLYSLKMQGFLNRPDTCKKVVEEINQVIKSLSKEAKSKMVYFMILRTGFSALEELENDEFVGHYITISPDFEKEYLILYVYNLHLEAELLKVLENCTTDLSLELLDGIIPNLKNPSCSNLLYNNEHIFQLCKSIYVKLCKIDNGLHGSENSASHFLKKFKDVFSLIKGTLRIIMTAEKDVEIVGDFLHNFFNMFLCFLKLLKFPRVCDDPLYKSSVVVCKNKPSISNNFMTTCVKEVLESIPHVLENFTIDMWLNFSECYLPSDSKNSMQLLIGDLVYNIVKELKETELPENFYVTLNVLSSLAINKADLMAKTEIEEVLRNVENGDKEWFSVLVRHSDFSAKKSINCLIDNLKLANSEDLTVILKTSYEFLCNYEETEDLGLMKKLFLNALRNSAEYLKWLEKIFEKYQPNILKTDDTDDELTETFNKLSMEKTIPDCNLVSLCVQSPVDTIKKTCHIAVYGSEQTEYAIQILKFLKPACSVLVSENFILLDYVLLKFILEELSEKEEKSYVVLFSKLGKENLLGPSFSSNLLRSLKDYLEMQKLEKAVYCLNIIKTFLELKIFNVNKAAFLVFICQVLENFSWDLKSFTTTKAKGREMTLYVVKLIIKELEKEDDPNFHWARHKILQSGELNQAPFCDLWFKYNYSWPGAGNFYCLILALAYSNERKDFFLKLDKPMESRASTILSLGVLLPMSCFMEWHLIFINLISFWKGLNSTENNENVSYFVLDQFGTALHLIIANYQKDETTYPCYKQCLRNFSVLIKQNVKINATSAQRIFVKIFLLLGTIEDDEKRKCCWTIFPCILMECVNTLKESNTLEVHKKDVEELLPFLDLKDVASAIREKMQ